MSLARLCILAGRIWAREGADHLSAALAYYIPFALTPLLLISISIVGIVSGRTVVSNLLYGWGAAIDPALAELLQLSVQNFDELTAGYSIPILAVLFFSGMVLVALNMLARGIQKMYGVTLTTWRQKLGVIVRSFIFLVVVQGYILFVVLLGYVVPYLANFTSLDILNYTTGPLLFVTTSVLAVFGYSVLSPTPPSLPARVYAALLTSGLFMFSRLIVGIHLAAAPIPALFGAAGLIIVLLIWLYVAATIIFYGAAFARAYDELSARRSTT